MPEVLNDEHVIKDQWYYHHPPIKKNAAEYRTAVLSSNYNLSGWKSITYR